MEETPAAPPHSLHSLGLGVKFRPTESLRKTQAGCALDNYFCTGGRGGERQAHPNFPRLRAPHALWSSRGRIPDVAHFPKARPARGPAELSWQTEAGLAVQDGRRGAGKRGVTRACLGDQGAPRHLRATLRKREKRARGHQHGDARGFTGNTHTSQSTDALLARG